MALLLVSCEWQAERQTGSHDDNDDVMYELCFAFSYYIDFSEECNFDALKLDSRCNVDLNGTNKGFENDTLLGLVTLVQNATSFCNQTDKDVTIYKCE